jgi:spermidine synthase
VILLFFFASGLSALVYQVVWTRAAGLAMGNSPAAVGTVVAIFMGGLAIGSAWGGRAAARVRPLRLYGILEIAVGLLALAVPLLFRAVEPLFAAAYGTPFFLPAGILASSVVLLPATILMGATFPLLVGHAGGAEAAGRLYAANSAGAALGALGAGLFLVPRIGYTATTAVAVAVNLVVGALSLRMGSAAPAPATPSAPVPLSRPEKAAVAVYAISGFAALASEMAWTRALVLALGSTVYAFALILAGFILGLALGSALAARRAPLLRNPLRAAAALQLAIAGWGALLVYLLADLPVRMADVIALLADHFLLLQLAEAAVVLGLVLVPTALMGALLPVTLAVFRGDAARSVGRLYAGNTLAAIAGTLAATFLLVPSLGLDWTLRIVCGLNLVAALVAAAFDPEGQVRFRGILGTAAAAIGLGAAALPSWDLALSASGSYLFALGQGADPASAARRQPVEAAYWDAFGLVTIHRAPGGRTLRVNGKTDASSGSADMPAQVLTAQIPLALHEDPREVLVIGLASGITLASAQSHGPAAVDCCEISPAVLRGSAHFADANGGALARPGTRILLQDGRTHVRYGGRSYDAIISEPSNLWVSGMAHLFTVDFFREARARLKPGGVLAQWVQAYRISRDDFRGVLRGFSEVFPEAHLWEMNPQGDYLLTGFLEPASRSFKAVRGRTERPEVARMLRSAGIADAPSLLACYVMGPEEVAEAARGARRLTDDDCWIEYTAPLSMLRWSLGEVYGVFEGRARSSRRLFDPASLGDLEGRSLDRYARSRADQRGAISCMGGRDPRLFRERIDALIESNPEDALARQYAEQEGRTAYRQALHLHGQGLHAPAMTALSGVPRNSAVHPDALVLEGWILVLSERPREARERYGRALQARPGMVEAQVGLAQIAEREGKADEARRILEKAVSTSPRNSGARTAYARFLWRRGEKERARAELEQALRDAPGDAAALELRRQFGSE